MSENFIKKGSFEEAINRSLDALVAAKKPFKQVDVIANAKFNDGSGVGKTTLYKKNAVGSFFYEELLKKIKKSVDDSRKGANKKQKNVSGPKEMYEQLKAEYELLERENQQLVDTVVEQESHLKRLKSADSIDKSIVKKLELQLYLANSILSKTLPKSSRAYIHARKIVENFETKYRGTPEMKQIDNQLLPLIENISYTNLVEFPNS